MQKKEGDKGKRRDGGCLRVFACEKLCTKDKERKGGVGVAEQLQDKRLRGKHERHELT